MKLFHARFLLRSLKFFYKNLEQKKTNLKIRTKLSLTALAMSLIPAMMIWTFTLYQSREALKNQAFSQLESVREIKKAQLETFFAERRNDMNVLLDMVANLKQNKMPPKNSS